MLGPVGAVVELLLPLSAEQPPAITAMAASAATSAERFEGPRPSRRIFMSLGNVSPPKMRVGTANLSGRRRVNRRARQAPFGSLDPGRDRLRCQAFEHRPEVFGSRPAARVRFAYVERIDHLVAEGRHPRLEMTSRPDSASTRVSR